MILRHLAHALISCETQDLLIIHPHPPVHVNKIKPPRESIIHQQVPKHHIKVDVGIVELVEVVLARFVKNLTDHLHEEVGLLVYLGDRGGFYRVELPVLV